MSASRDDLRTPGVLIGAVTAFALVATLTSCGATPASPPQPTPTVTLAPSASPVPSASPPEETPTASDPAVSWTWELHSLPGGPARGAARIGDRWIALDGLQGWSSADAVAWEEVSVDGTPQETEGQINLGPVAQLGDTSYAIGMWYGPGDAVHPVVWASTNGESWTQVNPGEPWGFVAYDVASDGAQLAVAGTLYDYGDGRVWTSSDAATWTEHVSDGGPATMHAVHGDADGFVAVGFRLDTRGAGVPTIWYSRDGSAWRDALVPPAEGPLTLLDVARLPGGRYAALGIRGTETEIGEIVTWFADDPMAWSAAPDQPRGLVPGHLLSTHGGMLAITSGRSGPVVRISTDGVNWSEEAPLPLPDAVIRVSAVATDGTDVVLLGSTLEGDAHFAWLGHPARN